MISLPEDVKYIMNKLKDAGYEAYIVGGCVRDALLDRSPQDWDVTTNAHPEVVQALFDKTIEIGKKFGTIKVLINDTGYEVTTFRCESDYSDARRPDKVCFSDSIEEDLRRRDFTINAMAYNLDRGIIDLFNGLKHLKEKKIKCVGNANERFGEDALRIMRCIRFSSQLEFKIEEKTYEAILESKEKLKEISAERIREEFSKILLTPQPYYGLSLLFATEIGNIFFIDTENNLPFEKIEGLNIINKMPIDLELRLTQVLYTIYKERLHIVDRANEILNYFKYDNKTKNNILFLLENYCIITNIKTSYELKKIIRKIGKELSRKLLLMYSFDKNHCEHSLYLDSLYSTIIENNDPIDYKDLKIVGEDLIEAGFQGEEVGKVIEMLIDIIHTNPEKNNREVLRKIIYQIKIK